MANVKNFGLVGVGSDLQFGKAGTRLVNNSGIFNFKAANGSTDAAVTTAGLTSSAGNVTLTTGNLVLSAESGKLSVGGTDLIQKSAGGVPQISGAAAVLVPTGDTAARPAGVAGLVRVNNDAPTAAYVEFHNGTTWMTLATGGDATALQTEVNNIEATLGSMVNTDGTTNVAAALTNTLFGGATNLTTALVNLASGVAGKDTLDEIFPSTGVANVIYAGAGNTWLQAAPGVTSGVQGYDAGLAALAAKTSTGIMVQTGAVTYGTATITGPAAGITVTNGDGVAGNPTLALADDLAALEGLASTGFAVRTASNVWAQRQLVAPAAGFTITNADGVAGDPTFALSNDLAALEGLTTLGYMVRTGDGTATTRSLNVVSGDLVITGDASGATTDTTFGLATVSQAATGTFLKVTLDTKGRVTGNTAVTTADITALVDATYVNLSGDTMTGNLIMSGATVTGLPDPVNASDAANKNYVDNAVTGLSWKQAVAILSITDIALTGLYSIQGYTLLAGDRVLVTNQTTDADNGIYVAAAGAWVRATDANVFSELNGASVFSTDGTYADSAWVQTATLSTFAGQTWVQFSGAGAYTGGTGIDVAGTVISVLLGAGIMDLPTGEVGADIASGKAIQLTNSTTSGQITFVLDEAVAGDSGLIQSASGLKIQAAKVTNAMLTHSQFTLNGDTGTDSLILGDTLQIKGTSTQGISTATTESPAGTSTVTITAADASSSQKGVATFDATEFTVTAGNVVLGTVPIAKLAASTITFAGNTGAPEAVSLGETVTISSADSAITVTTGTNALSFQLNTVDVPHGGTGLTTLAAGRIPYGAGTSALGNAAAFAFNGTDTLTVGTGTFQGSATDVVVTATATNGDIVLMPNGTGSVIVGPVGAGIIQSDTGTALTVRGNTVLTLESGTGSTLMKLATGTATKVSVSGPTAADYATGLASNDLTNKQYVDTAIASGAAAGAVKAFTATVSLAADGTTNIGTAMPAGATVLSVKVRVDVVNPTSTLSVGKSGSVAAYMTTAENDAQSTGLYMAECYVTEAGVVQLIGTVAGQTTGVGSCVVIVTYQVAQ
jgi:hypothetical protein